MIYLDQPEITDSDAFEIAWEAKHGDPSTRSETVNKFEQAISKYLKVPDAVAVNSGTSALFLSLLACGVGKNDEVILPVLTFIATANAVSYTGAKVRFVDVDEKTWNMCHLESICAMQDNHNVKVILPVDLYGNPFSAPLPYMVDGWVFDSTESLGSQCGYRYEGADNICYSFNGNKTLTTGGGGLIVGNNLSKIRRLADVGRDKNGKFVEIGYNYRMNGLAAALGLSQLKRIDETVNKKRRINEIYRNELDNILTFQTETPNSKSSFWMTACTFPAGTDILVLQKKLLSNNIPTRRIFQPLNQLKPYLNNEKFPIANMIFSRGLCLPSSVKNSENQILEVCRKVGELL